MGKYTDKTCCFTGHRIIPPGEESKILIRVRHRLIPLIQSGVTYFGVGGALGFDTMMADMLLELKKENSRMRIIEVLPFEGYRAKWTPEQQLHAKNLDRQMDKIPRSRAGAHILRGTDIWWMVLVTASATATSRRAEQRLP